MTTERLKRLVIEESKKSIGNFSGKINGINVKDFDISIMECSSHVEQRYINGICCLKSDLFFFITENEHGMIDLIKLSFSGKIKNIDDRILAKWDAKTVGEQLLLLNKAPTFLIKYETTVGIGLSCNENTFDNSLSVYEIGKRFFDDYSQQH